MCDACDSDPNVLDAIEDSWVEYESATHVVIGYRCDGSGGIMGTADNEFTAWRYAKMLKDMGWLDVKVCPNKDATFKEVSNRLSYGMFR